MKRALGLIDSKMAQAKNWLRDPNAQPGDKNVLYLKLLRNLIEFSDIIDVPDCACCTSRGRGRAGHSTDPWWSWESRWTVCWEGAQRYPGHSQDPRPDDWPGVRDEGQVQQKRYCSVCLCDNCSEIIQDCLKLCYRMFPRLDIYIDKCFFCIVVLFSTLNG